jgi:hypothetical protein
MKSYNTFIFDSYLFDAREGLIELRYSLDDELEFTETLQLPAGHRLDTKSPKLEAALFALHLIGGISYFKTCLPKRIEIRSGSLTKEQADFWNSVYENGLGEFAFKNDINLWNTIKFPFVQKEAPLLALKSETKKQFLPRVLVPIGGGKDSIVTAELCKKQRFHTTLLRMGDHPFIDELAELAVLPMLTIDRRISPALFKLNTQGALNGHVPITAYLSFLTLVLAELYGFDAVIMSNERSANEGNVAFHGKEINHQWSKSLEFEKALQDYIRTFIGSNVNYFSLLRPLSELQIVKLFTQYPQYFEHFTSCNANWKLLSPLPRTGEGSGVGANRWCNKCPKCAFAFLLMSAFLGKEQLMSIFGKNLFEDEALLPLYRELLGIEGFKPFECVGTPDESKAAFLLAHKRGELEETAIMKMFLQDVMPTIKDPEGLIKSVLTSSPEHAIPENFTSLVPSS